MSFFVEIEIQYGCLANEYSETIFSKLKFPILGCMYYVQYCYVNCSGEMAKIFKCYFASFVGEGYGRGRSLSP